jgi:2-iminoacetate synthase
MDVLETIAGLPGRATPRVRRFQQLLAPKSPAELEGMARKAAALTRRHFGRTMRLFAPLYLSNECINNCAYCGFSRDNPILRVTLDPAEVEAEAAHLAAQGFRNLLLVAGEHPKFVPSGYLEECLHRLRSRFPTLGVEVGPMEVPEYRRMVQAGAEGLVVYQETYDPDAYQSYHTAGPKRDFEWRLRCPERGAEAGFRRIGIGALFGLSEWRAEAARLAAHLEFLQSRCWKSAFTVSFPRLRPAPGGFEPPHPLADRDFVHLVLAFRACFPETGIVLSTREPAALRDALVPLGVTHMSAGSHTEPGGYTGQGRDDVHLTVRGRRVEVGDEATCASGGSATAATAAAGQFSTADHRSPAEVCAALERAGFEPVWKDWDQALQEGARVSAAEAETPSPPVPPLRVAPASNRGRETAGARP